MAGSFNVKGVVICATYSFERQAHWLGWVRIIGCPSHEIHGGVYGFCKYSALPLCR
jgi:hypothetical protein